jgi:hypothetical protein
MNIYPTLIIGVGGSGKLACKFIKKYFAERFPADWLNPATQLPPIVDMVVMETEPGNEKEELSISKLPDVQTIAAYIDKPTLKAMQGKAFLTNHPEISSWLSSPLPVTEIVGGAGQIRQAGRLAFFRHRTAFGNIKKAITNVLENIGTDSAINLCKQRSKGGIKVPDRTPRCYIISSVCGGTGSGMLFDIAGIVNQVGVRTNLIAFLPKMFESKIDLTESIWQIYANTYATLKEANHYMTGNYWSVSYDEGRNDRVIGDKKLFDYCFLVDKESDNVDLKDRSRVTPLVAEFLFQMITEIEYPFNTTESNFKKLKDAEIASWVNGLGVAIISFPLEEIRDVLVNWGIRDLITRHLSMDFSLSEIDALVSDRTSGRLYTEFSYKTWEDALLDKNGYSSLSADTLIKKRGLLESKIRDEKSRIEREYKDDLRRIRDGYEKYLDTMRGRFTSFSDGILCSKGPAYFGATIEKFKQELRVAKTSLENDQQKLDANIKQLNDTVEKQIKTLTKISKKGWFAAIGWAKRIHPHMDSVLRLIRDLFGGMLKAEKHKYSLRIIADIENMIDCKMSEYSSLMEKLRNIGSKTEGEESRLLSALIIGSEAHIKVKSDDDDVKNFFKVHVEPGLPDLGTNLRKSLTKWKNESEETILGEIRTSLDSKIKGSGFDDLTILGAMKNDMEELGQLFQDCINNKSMPFIRHAGRPIEEKYFISGFKKSDLEELRPPGNMSVITSNLERNKRKFIFVRMSAGFSLQDLGPYDFEKKYAKAYSDALEKGHGWIHIQKEAPGFEDPLGLSIGLEEESLIKTCLDVGIIYVKKGNHFEYGDDGAEKTLAQGLEKAIGAIHEDQKLARLLKKKLADFFNGKDATWVVGYLNDHVRDNFADDGAFSENHKAKYKNSVPGNEFALTQHKIPSYVLKEIEKRLGKK